jgi:hypothetical protein
MVKCPICGSKVNVAGGSIETHEHADACSGETCSGSGLVYPLRYERRML